MGGVARLAVAAGHTVRGSDANVYPPMDQQLRDAGIEIIEGYSADNLKPSPDVVLIGNAISRGNPELEYTLDQRLNYSSGAQWLGEQVLRDQWVLAVAGTHGKTTTTSMLAWILEYAGLQPGFLIGGVPQNFGQSARYGGGSFFVVEADEYDTAFFDKRSKFVHYRPRTQILNNLEFDHADIFDSLADIKRQFHHLVRMLPASAKLIVNGDDNNLREVLEMGCWSEREFFSCSENRSAGADWYYNASQQLLTPDQKELGLECGLGGLHNSANATAAVAAARHSGVPVAVSIQALREFAGVKRRLELIGEIDGVHVYDDFAHHPTAIAATLRALKPETAGRLHALVDFRSNSMASGTHIESMPAALRYADSAYLYNAQPERLHLQTLVGRVAQSREFVQVDELLTELAANVAAGDVIACMSNGSFAGIHQQILTMLKRRSA